RSPEQSHCNVPVGLFDQPGKNVAGGVGEVAHHNTATWFGQGGQVTQHVLHHVFTENVEEEVGDHHVVLFGFIHFEDIEVKLADRVAKLLVFLVKLFLKLAQHGF